MLYFLVHSVTIIVMYDYHHLYNQIIIYFLPGNINEPASEPAHDKLVLYSFSVTASPRGMQCPALLLANGDRSELWAWLLYLSHFEAKC